VNLGKNRRPQNRGGCATRTGFRQMGAFRRGQEAPLSRIDQDEVQAAPHRHAELMRREEESCFRQFMRLGTFLVKLQDRREKRARNEGAPGYVDENTMEGKTDPMTNCPEMAARTPPPPSPRRAADRAEAFQPTTGSAGSEVRRPKSEVRRRTPSEVARQTVRGAGSEVESGRPSKVDQAAAHGRMPDSGFRIPDKHRPGVQGPLARWPDEPMAR